MAEDVLIKIRTALESGGIDAAKSSLIGLENQAKETANAGKELSFYEKVGFRIAAGITVATTAFAAFIKKGIDTADQLNVVSKRVGVSVEELSRLKFAAEQTETNFDTLTRGLQRLNINIGKTGEEGAELQPVLLGIAEKIKDAGSAADQAAIANQAFGRGIGAELLPFLKEGEEGIRKLIGSEADFAEISTEAAQAADDFNDNLGRLSARVTALAIDIGGPLVDSINQFFDAVGRAGEIEAAKDANEKFRESAKGIVDDIAEIDAQLAGGAPATEGIIRRREALELLKKSLIETRKEELGIGQQGSEFVGPPKPPDTATNAAVEQITKIKEAQSEADKAAEKSAKAAASEAKKQASASREFSESLTKQITISDAQAQALNRGGQAGAQYKIVQTQIAQAIAANIPVTAALREEIDRFAESQTRLAGVQFSEGLKVQTAEVNLQREALATGGVEGARFTVVQTEINKAIAAGAEVTPALRAEIEKYAGSVALLSSEEFSQSIKEQTASIVAQGEAFSIGNETSAQYAELQKSIVEQLQRGIPVTDEQRQALESLGQEGERYAIIQSKIAEAEANGIELKAELIQQIRDQADAQVGLNSQKEVSELTERAAEETARAFDRQSEAITQTLTDAIFRGFENGKGFAENFKDTVVNLFKTLVLRPIIEAVVKPVAQAVSGVVGSVISSVLGGGGGGGGGGGIFGSLINTGVTTLVGEGLSSFAGGGGGSGFSLGNLFSGGASAASQVGTLAGGVGGTSTIPGFVGQVIPSLVSSAGSLTTSALGLNTITGTLSQSAILAAQELGTAVGGQAFGSAAAGVIGQVSNALAAASSAGPAFAVSGVLGNLAGGAVAQAGGNNTASIAAGAAAGAVIGSVVPVIGTIIGAIIGGVSGIQPSPPRGFQSADLSSGRLRIRKKGRGDFDAGEFDKPVNDILASLDEIDKVLKLSLDKKRIKFFIGFNALKGFRANVEGQDKDFKTLPQAQGAIFKEELLGSLPKKDQTKFQQKVLQRAFAPENDLFVEQLKSIKKDLEVQQRLKAFTKVVEFDPAKEQIKALEKELRKLTTQFSSLKKEAQELGLDTKRAEAALKKIKQRTKDEILGIETQKETEKITVQQQAFQLAGQALPPDLQVAGITAQFKVLGIEFRKLGLDTKILDDLLGEALANLQQQKSRGVIQAQAQGFQLAGRQVPIETQQALLIFQSQDLARGLRDLGLGADELTLRLAQNDAFLAQALENLQAVQAQARIQVQGQAFQLAGRQVPIELQQAGLQLQFAELGEAFLDLGLDASGLAALLAEALANLDEAREAAKVQVQSQAFQLAGRQVPIELQRAGLQIQFAEIGQAFLDLGLDASGLSALLAEALANLDEAQQAARVQVQSQAFQASGRVVPIDLQRAALVQQFAELGDAFRELGLDTSFLARLLEEGLGRQTLKLQQEQLSADASGFQLAGREIPIEIQRRQLILEFSLLGDLQRQLGLSTANLTVLLAEGLANLDAARQRARVQAKSQAFELAGRPVPVALQKQELQLQFAELGKQFRELGLDSSILAKLLSEALANLDAARQKARLQVQSQAFQLAGREVPLALQQASLKIEFAELGKQFAELGLDARGLSGLLAEALQNLELARQQARQSALERAYQLAGEEVPKELQIAGITAEFAALGKQFLELGLDTGILGPLLQKAIDKINKAGEDLRTGGFIGFIDEFGRITEAFGEAANDTQFFGERPSISSLPSIPSIPSMPRVPIGPRRPDLVTRPDLFLVGDRVVDSPKMSRSSNSGRSVGDVNININGPAIFDDITQQKFTREVDRKLRSRGQRFG